jgi:hypothetical protein
MSTKLPQLYVMTIDEKAQLLRKHGYTVNLDEDTEEDLDFTIEGDVEAGSISVSELR